MLRRRAENLARELQRIEVGRTKFAQVQDTLRHWPTDYDGKAPCTEAECSAHVGFKDFAYKHQDLFSNRVWLSGAYRVLGGRPARADLGVHVKNGIAVSKSYTMSTGVFSSEVALSRSDKPGDGYMLIGTVTTRENLRGRRQTSTHPTYWVGWPAGCEVCVAMEVESTPDAPAELMRSLDQLNFSCVTRWFKPCRERGDIMPEAWAEAKREGPI